MIDGRAHVHGSALIYDNAILSGDAHAFDYVSVYGNARVLDNAIVRGISCVFGDSIISGNGLVINNAEICGDAEIKSFNDYVVFKEWWGRGVYITWTRSNNMWKTKDFYGTGDELVKKAYKDSELSGREYERIVKYVEEIRKDNGK